MQNSRDAESAGGLLEKVIGTRSRFRLWIYS